MCASTLSIREVSTSESFAFNLKKRKVKNYLFWALGALALIVALLPLFWLLFSVFYSTIPKFSPSVLIHTSQGVKGGLSNALVGSIVLLFAVGIVAGLVGVCAAIYIAEFAPKTLAKLLRSATELVAGLPSIVLGYVGYIALVVKLGMGFSLLAAVITLSVFVLPYVCKTTELALSKVPVSYREGGAALGMTKTEVLFRILLRPASGAILTGLILALAVSAGETAPLLYTANWSDSYPQLALTHSPVGYLTYLVWTDFNQPFESGKIIANDAGMLLILMVFVLIVISRIVSSYSKKNSPEAMQKPGGGSISKRIRNL